MQHKTLSRVRVKDADLGQIEAVFSTLGVEDSDGDVTVAGAFTDGAPVVISAYGHRSWDGDLPLGKGTIREVDDEVILDGEFFMDTTHGKDAFLTVKALSESGLQEWSYSLENVTAELGELDGKRVRFIKSVNVKEVSPVLRGAGVNTRTLAAKSADGSHDYEITADAASAGSKFSAHADTALSGVKAFAEHAAERIAHRQAQGKSTDEQRDALDQLMAELEPLRKALDTTPSEPSENNDLHAEWLRSIAILQRIEIPS